ncbi:MAG: glycosyltransferase family 39 protein [Euryarchaeota archaeon]|nr:glycosyltransferase family 39 protein [Euryarchaeota archaeon]
MRCWGFLKSWYFWLFLITGIAIVVRSFPAWMNAAWGGDFGIYYGLTSRFVENQQIFNEYNGWGGMYNYFPVLYIFSALGHWITGVDLLWVMPKIAPVFGGLTVLIFYFIVYDLTKRRDLALLSAVFLAVIPFHVYQTSHAAPLTMGHFFMMLCCYLFLKYMDQKKYLVPLMISTVFLIMSHHLTTYFFLITIFFFVVIKSIRTDLRTMYRDVAYVLAASAMTFSYWIFIATPVFSTFMNNGLSISSYFVILLFYVALFGCLLANAAMKKKKPQFIHSLKKTFTFHPAHSRKRALIYFTAGFVFIFCAEIVFLFVNFPVSGIRMKPLSILYSIPMLFFIGFGCLGVEYLKHVKNRWFFQAWLCAILSSFIYSLVTVNTTLFPDRHVEYLTVPACLFAAVGVLYFFRFREHKVSLSLKKQLSYPSIQVLFVLVVCGLVFSNAVAVYPVYTSLEWMDESIPNETANAINWINDNLDRNDTVVATDLRLSKMIWAEGINATFEGTNDTWTCDTWVGCVADFDADESHQKVTHVLIDDVMRDVSVNVRVTQSVYMTNESYLKFSQEPFTLVYRNATVNQDNEEIHWAAVYSVNWTFIEQHLMVKK